MNYKAYIYQHCDQNALSGINEQLSHASERQINHSLLFVVNVDISAKSLASYIKFRRIDWVRFSSVFNFSSNIFGLTHFRDGLEI